MAVKSESWVIVLGFVMTIAIVALLLSTPSMIFAKSVGVVDTELRQAGPNAQRVLVKFDLGDKERLDNLPKRMGEWKMDREYDWDNIGVILNTDVLLSRDYNHPAVYQPVHLLIVQSSNVSSFHPAPVCYRVQGWEVPAEGRLTSVSVANATWAQERWLSDQETRVFDGTLTAKVLEVTKGDEKRVALYVYLKREDWRVTNEVTWVRTEIAIPSSASAADVEAVLADLLAEVIPHLFSFQAEDEDLFVEAMVASYGWPAGVAGVLAASAPAAASLVAVRRNMKAEKIERHAAEQVAVLAPAREGPK